MSENFDLWDIPNTEENYLIAGWRHWVDGGSVSSGLPYYLRDQTDAKKIGELNADDCYLFQLPITQGLFRPTIKYDQGFPVSLQTKANEFYYSEVNSKGVVLFVGDEPHLNAEKYIHNFLEAVKKLNIKRITVLGGIYAEVPYDRDRFVSSAYSLKSLKPELEDLSVNLSDYQGAANIGSYLCKRAEEQGIEMVSFYTFVPILQLPNFKKVTEDLSIEKDYKSWLDVIQRVNHMLGLNLDLSDLEEKSEQMIEELDTKIDKIDKMHPELGIKEYIDRLSMSYTEQSFSPLEDIWQDALRNIDNPPHSEE